MVDILAQPEQFKAELKDKWLDYYEANRSWLQHYMDINTNWYDSFRYDEKELASLGFHKNYSPRLPNCYFILGVVSVLEPSIKGLFAFMEYSTANSEKIVTALGLDFEPEIELKKRSRERRGAERSQQLEKQQSEADSQYLDQIREEIKT